MVDDESRKWQVWHDFVKRGSYLEKENTHTARQQNSSYLDLHQQWPPNNKKMKIKNDPDKTGHAWTANKKNTKKNPGRFSCSQLPHPLDGWGPVASLQSWEPNMKRWVVAIHTKFIPENATVEIGQLLVTFYSIIYSFIYLCIYSSIYFFIIYLYVCVSIYREAESECFIHPQVVKTFGRQQELVSTTWVQSSEMKRFAQLVVEFTQLKKLSFWFYIYIYVHIYTYVII